VSEPFAGQDYDNEKRRMVASRPQLSEFLIRSINGHPEAYPDFLPRFTEQIRVCALP
jgi:hypothetical protein